MRIEDTDSQRFVPGAEDYINESLRWCGINIDEGVNEGGAYAPYRQSERREIYLKYAMDLIESGNAYYAFDTPEELTSLRESVEAKGEVFSYNYTIREELSTSLKLSSSEVEERKNRGDQWVVRFKMPEGEIIHMKDLIRGDISVNTSTLDDKVLYKSSDALPTYHLANIVDDKLMDISHVIRGEEWLPSLPLHYLLYRSFGWSDVQPEFAHLPLLLKPTGKGKLSKRDGDKMGFPVFPLKWVAPTTGETARGYREDGYFPESFINMIALLGWNPGNDIEIMDMEQLTELFSLDKVGKSGARFDPEKAKWFNSQYMQKRDNSELAELFLAELKERGIDCSLEVSIKVTSLIKERTTFISDFWGESFFIFEAPTSFDEKVVSKFWKGENPTRMAKLKELLTGIEDFSAKNTEPLVHDWIKSNEFPMGQIMNSLRLVIVGESKGPSMFDICEMIGKEETLRRIEFALNKLATV